MEIDEQYAELIAPFEQTYELPGRGGQSFTHITGEQATSRLNLVLGFDQWSFRVIETRREEGWIMVLGEIAYWPASEKIATDQPVVRQQWGGAPIKKGRDGNIIDLADDYKAAATYALKKCAMLFGVALYLSSKEEIADQEPAR